MDCFMAYRASLILRRLVMKIWRSRSSAEGGSRMALQAENVQVAGLDQAGIGRTMWGMAGHAAFGLYWLVLENEWSLLIDVAVEADSIPRGRRAELLADEPTVGVVTIRTLNESFFHPMVERHVELRLDLLVARVAEIWLSFDQQKLIRGCMVGGMAV